MRHAVALAVALMVTGGPRLAQGADVPVIGKKLVVVDKLTAVGKAKAVFVAKDGNVDKGSGTDETQIGAELDVSYDSASGVFLAPQGSDWLVHKDTVARRPWTAPRRSRAAPATSSCARAP